MSAVRLSDIAKAAGVSVSAVSKSLADSPQISAETKQKVRKIADEMGYHSNSLARSLRLGKSNLLGVIIPNNDNPYYSGILQGISEHITNDYNVIIANSGEDAERELSAIRSLLSIPVAAILSVPVKIANYDDVSVPLVFLSRYPYRALSAQYPQSAPSKTYSYIVNDDYEGQRLAVSPLAERGFQNIYLFLDTDELENAAAIKSFARLDGYKQGLKENGIPFDAKKVTFHIDSIESCFAATNQICKAHPEGNFAICTANDFTTLGAIAAIKQNDLSIPEQVALIGYDNIESGAYFSPPLTTIHVATKELGHYGAMHIRELLNRESQFPQTIATVLQPTINHRKSV